MIELKYTPQGRLDEVDFCQKILEKHPMRCIRGRLYTPDGVVEDEGQVGQLILESLNGQVNIGLNKLVRNLLDTLKLLSYAEAMAPQTDRIHVANGTCFLDGSFTAEKEFCPIRLKVAYDPNAPVPWRWLTFLEELLEPEDILTLQEYLGYCLIPSTKAQKMLIILGRGGEGKSRIGLVMRAILGSGMNQSSIQKLETNRFSRADLENRLLMVDDDMDLAALPKTNYIKSIVTAEEAMDLERKGVQSYQARLYTRFLCFGNGALTSLYDQSDGFFRRQMVLTAKDRPGDRVDDPFLGDKLVRESQGIFLWCLEGLNRLISNNFRFTQSQKAVDTVAQIRTSNNNILEFLDSEGYIRFRDGAQATSKQLYEAYKLWCEDNLRKVMSSTRLGTELGQNEDKYKVKANRHIRAGNKSVRGYDGVEVIHNSGLY